MQSETRFKYSTRINSSEGSEQKSMVSFLHFYRFSVGWFISDYCFWHHLLMNIVLFRFGSGNSCTLYTESIQSATFFEMYEHFTMNYIRVFWRIVDIRWIERKCTVLVIGTHQRAGCLWHVRGIDMTRDYSVHASPIFGTSIRMKFLAYVLNQRLDSVDKF